MNNIDTYPIEFFLEKAKIVLKTNQKSLTLDVREVEALRDCLSLVMTRLVSQSGVTDKPVVTDNALKIKMDGGQF
jgi:hypothetical protein